MTENQKDLIIQQFHDCCEENGWFEDCDEGKIVIKFENGKYLGVGGWREKKTYDPLTDFLR